ncbi:MAG: YbhB/YbcL family Raf kinase inhibitor-like protein [Halanaerobiales bacterium]|nr:YbhB/YbcL family Raf kinase inhibitor-like protein [Halanaerobiales bacterium]
MNRDLIVTSNAFEDGDMIPQKYTKDGKDISPPLTIKGISTKGESIAVIMDDPDAPVGTFTHWLIWNIPIGKNNIPEGVHQDKEVETLNGAIQGLNDFGEIGYRGPAPPSGVHNYHFKVYILDQKLDLTYDATKNELVEEVDKHMLQKSKLVAKYKR